MIRYKPEKILLFIGKNLKKATTDNIQALQIITKENDKICIIKIKTLEIFTNENNTKVTGKMQKLEILITENKIFTDKLQALEKLSNTYNKNIQTQTEKFRAEPTLPLHYEIE